MRYSGLSRCRIQVPRSLARRPEAVEPEEPLRADRPLQPEGERPEGEGVEQQVHGVGMHEAAGDEGGVLALGNQPVGPEEAPLDQPRCADQADRAGADHHGEEHASDRCTAGQRRERIHERTCLRSGAGRMHRSRRRRGSARRPEPDRGSPKTHRGDSMFEAPVAASSLAGHIDAAAKEIEGQVIAWRRDLHQPRARQPRGAHRRHGRRAPARARLRRGAHRRRPHRRGRRAEGRAARPGGGAARRHGRAAGGRGGRRAVRLARCGAVERRDGRRHARLRPRRPHRDPDGRGRGARRACATQLPGTVKFIFQPAEETPPDGEEGGAQADGRGGRLEKPDAGAVFGLHVTSALPHRQDRLPLRAG